MRREDEREAAPQWRGGARIYGIGGGGPLLFLFFPRRHPRLLFPSVVTSLGTENPTPQG